MAARKGRQIKVFDPVTGGRSEIAAAFSATFCYVEDSTHCEGVMYIKWRGDEVTENLGVYVEDGASNDKVGV